MAENSDERLATEVKSDEVGKLKKWLADYGIRLLEDEESKASLIFKGDNAGLLLTDKRLIYASTAGWRKRILVALHRDVTSVIDVFHSKLKRNVWLLVSGIILSVVGIIWAIVASEGFYWVEDAILPLILTAIGVLLILYYRFVAVGTVIVISIGAYKVMGDISGRRTDYVSSFVEEFYKSM